MSSEQGGDPYGVAKPRRKRVRWDCNGRRKRVTATAFVSDFLPAPQANKVSDDVPKSPRERKGHLGNQNPPASQKVPVRLKPTVTRQVGPGKTLHAGKKHFLAKGKLRNPDAPFNHRARYSKFKRSIVELRREVFESLINGDQQSSIQDALAAVAVGSSVTSSSENTALTSPSHTLQPLQALVGKLHSLYARLHSEMNRKSYVKAARCLTTIRRLRKRLNKTALRWKGGVITVNTGATQEDAPTVEPDTSQTRGECNEGASAGKRGDSEGAAKADNVGSDGEPNFVNFYPSLSLMGIGTHPLTAVIDQRSGRHPRQLTASEVAQLHNTTPDLLVAAANSNKPRNPIPRYLVSSCANILTDRLDDIVFTILQRQYTLQKRMKKEKPLQFKARKFYSTGMRETLRALRAAATRIPVVLIASDIELNGTLSPNIDKEFCVEREGTAENVVATVSRSQHKTVGELGVSGTLEEIHSHCVKGNIPLVTCMSRRKLAYALFAKGCNISIVVLHSAEGVHEEVRALRHYAHQLCEQYRRITPSEQGS
ncbi:hypothetical protein, conserved [Trypanosoma brucei gambiense DAL972]|uniref:Ribosomal protein L7Ae/L30e/S12e/Gadd45 domain-containing protein n=1 Tax=Trypanosoma brucei gambiense (strain MHOM/CI/86/DAL972) TaxID=679716 RepID=C9ZN70_TRYB9|nr:hypothetical protein, conserved [Trypanosoma brucei gambiense DAL972]CBH10724.1 hypothetical protein, conserved [Trypanosoma brucei gambiense DAL972]|eukprot:XP_011773012.1 hypothetical protein, conserved [Trypanosoma brucei gambiense DAL972]